MRIRTWRAALVSFVLVAASIGSAGAAETPVSLPVAPGALSGTLDVPAGAGPFPVVIILAGSGPTDRNGNSGRQLRSDAYELLAEGLAAKGIASLRYDKRGIGDSASAMTKESDLRFETYADDAAAWVAFLRKDPRFKRVFIAGHSEGSLVGMLAAQRVKVDGFISLAGAGRRIPALLHEQLAKGAPNVVVESDAIAAQLQRGQTVEDVPEDLMSLYRPSVQPYLISWFKYDPAAEIAKLAIPVAIVAGDADIQVPVSDAKLLAAAAPGATLVIVPGMSHTLKHVASTAQADEQPAYLDPSLPLDPAVVQAIVALIARAA
jgi:hypothetical protein